MDRDTGGGTLPEALLDVMRDPSQGRQRLPYLLELLDEGTVRVRLSAAWALCLVVESDPDLLEYAVRRLVDRLDPEPATGRPDDSGLEVRHALDYIAMRHPRATDEALAELDSEREVRGRERLYDTVNGFKRSEYGSQEGDDSHSRARVPDRQEDGDPRQVYASPSDVEDPLAGAESDGTGGDSDGTSDGDGTPERDDGEERDDPGGDDTQTGAVSDRGVTSGTLAVIRRRLSAVVEESRYDEISILDECRRERHADVYRAVGEVDETEHPLALWLFHLPDADRASFADGLTTCLHRWAEISDADAIHAVRDWGTRPRPWAAVETAELTLADRDAVGIETAVAETRRLAAAVSAAHQHGVVHGGIDPETVVYYGNALTDTPHRQPMLSAFGLATLVREHGGDGVPDPRYAAPEHADERFGSVDTATDVYGLGAVCYRLCTGRAPYTDDQVGHGDHVDGDPPVPSDAARGVPPALDRAVGKALAARKLTRYETVTALARELAAVDEALDE